MTYGKVVVSNDSGAMHLASVAEVPTVAIFGPTVLEFGYQPWNNMSAVVENKEINCRPCGKHGHEKCPIGTHVCMTSISANQVLEKIKALTP
jgi:heptosyltransferase-2